MRYILYGLSTWTLIFEDGTSFKLDAVSKEKIVKYASGNVKITLRNVIVEKELADKLVSGTRIRLVLQEALVRNAESLDYVALPFEYPNLQITKAMESSRSNEVGFTKIVLGGER